MELKYASPFERGSGIIEWLLNKSYVRAVESEPELWEPEKRSWRESDQNVFENPDTIGACTLHDTL